ncbi:hypothetical protein BV898_05743 [Hypsibius exemplaris]|uniref:Uncharacterized protein n=1 Tax=Hypsibius exemplaris TaxID=2072580 RepID=A0A1W0WY99_HYPEX|nr:hypothetical protein BV898_05743 [Hypsibius exemplaris]
MGRRATMLLATVNGLQIGCLHCGTGREPDRHAAQMPIKRHDDDATPSDGRLVINCSVACISDWHFLLLLMEVDDGGGMFTGMEAWNGSLEEVLVGSDEELDGTGGGARSKGLRMKARRTVDDG